MCCVGAGFLRQPVYAKDGELVANPIASALDSPDILSKVLLFVGLREVLTVTCTSRQWKWTMDFIEEDLWQQLSAKHYPSLERLVALLPPTEEETAGGDETANGRSSKAMFKRMHTLPWKPVGVNQQLQRDLAFVFFHEGVVAFTNCCHYNCSSAYNEDVESFVPRESNGIYFIRHKLNGMNYDPDIQEHDDTSMMVPANYRDFDYLMDHWEEECDLICRWGNVLGLEREDITIVKPESIHRCVAIEFEKKIPLEDWPDDENDEEEQQEDQDAEDNKDEAKPAETVEDKATDKTADKVEAMAEDKTEEPKDEEKKRGAEEAPVRALSRGGKKAKAYSL